MGNQHIKQIFRPISILLFLIIISVFVYAGYRTISAALQYKEGFETREELISEYVTVREQVKTGTDSPNKQNDSEKQNDNTGNTNLPSVIIHGDDNSQNNQTIDNPIEEEPEYAPIAIDFEGLKRENKDVIAWIYIPGTNISYPVVQGTDNQYYMHYNVKKQQSSSGAIMLDYRNSKSFTDYNSLVYGHLMRSDTMFGQLSRMEKDENFLKEHLMGYLLTPEQNYRLDFIAVGVVPAAQNPYYQIFAKQEDLTNYLTNVKDAMFYYNCEHPEDVTRIVTLSTCNKDFSGARLIVICTLKEIG